MFNNVFFISTKKERLIYFPLSGQVIADNFGLSTLIKNLRKDNFNIDKVKNNNILKTITYLKNNNKSLPQQKENSFVNNYSEIVLLPTTDCNLRCKYCYARGGEEKKYMSWELANAAVDFIFEESAKAKTKGISIVFHGGGEPTLAFNIIQRVVDYAREKGRKSNKNVYFTIATNGVLSDLKREYILKNINEVYISCDGPIDIQNFQRPTKNNQGSFNHVYDTFKYLDKNNKKYSLLSTVTTYNVKKLKKIIDFILENTKCRDISLQPVMSCGRCSNNDFGKMNPLMFAKRFLEARIYAQKLGIVCETASGDISRITDKYCESLGKNLFITPDGFITSCVQVVSENDPRSKIFIIGKYQKKKKKYTLDDKKIKDLSKRVVDCLGKCYNCFLKWNCAGECPALAMNLNGTIFSVPENKCIANKIIAQNKLIEIWKGDEKNARRTKARNKIKSSR